MAEDWRENRQDERIERLEDELREARQKIWALEKRPMDWLLKAEVAILYLLMVVVWVIAIVEIATKS
jgi:hypothetical protein